MFLKLSSVSLLFDSPLEIPEEIIVLIIIIQLNLEQIIKESVLFAWLSYRWAAL